MSSQNTGGRYLVEGKKKPKLMEAPTKEHPEGNAPRDVDGKRLDRPISHLGKTSSPEMTEKSDD